MLNDEEKKNLSHRLKRILGQVEAIGRMIEEDAYCVDTLMQVSAARGALGRVGGNCGVGVVLLATRYGAGRCAKDAFDRLRLLTGD